MGKQRPKRTGQRPEPVNATDWNDVAADLYERGLITRMQAFGHYTNWRQPDAQP